jgi:hypothetical protein
MMMMMVVMILMKRMAMRMRMTMTSSMGRTMKRISMLLQAPIQGDISVI